MNIAKVDTISNSHKAHTIQNMHTNPLQFKFQYLRSPEFDNISNKFPKTNKDVCIHNLK